MSVTENERFRSLIQSIPWTFAKTMPKWPHEYIVRGNSWSDVDFEDFVAHIRANGEMRRWGPYHHTYLDLDGWSYWTMGAPVVQTKIINRARL